MENVFHSVQKKVKLYNNSKLCCMWQLYTVYHSKLAIKVRAYGDSGNLLLWIADLLAGRSQVTKVGNSQSNEFNIISGVIQGSCLGRYCFSYSSTTYLHDVLPTSCMCKLYEDDQNLYASVNVGDWKATAIQESLTDAIYAWPRACSYLFQTRNAH